MDKARELKPAKTFEEQIEILKERKIIIENKEFAIKILSTTNYYRFTAYALQFKRGNEYFEAIKFEHIYRIYEFDKRLRSLLMSILESIEISMRTAIAYNLAIKYGAEAHMNSKNFENKDYHLGYIDRDGKYRKGLIDEINREISVNNKELFVKHHIKNYGGRFPIWAVIELVSFGALSKMFSNLKREDQRIISRSLVGLDYKLLTGGLPNLAYIRNVCAHYGRFYNKKIAVQPRLHFKYKKYDIDVNRVFASILTIKELIPNKEEWEVFKIQLEKLIYVNIEIINLELIGFPQVWQEILDL